jgi:hypothetical protein
MIEFLWSQGKKKEQAGAQDKLPAPGQEESVRSTEPEVAGHQDQQRIEKNTRPPQSNPVAQSEQPQHSEAGNREPAPPLPGCDEEEAAKRPQAQTAPSASAPAVDQTVSSVEPVPGLASRRRGLRLVKPEQRSRCQEILAALSEVGTEAKPFVPALLQLTKSSDAFLRQEALRALRRIDPAALNGL